MEGWFFELVTEGSMEGHSIAILTLWHVWKERIRRVFERKYRDDQAILVSIRVEFKDWEATKRKDSGQQSVINVASN